LGLGQDVAGGAVGEILFKGDVLPGANLRKILLQYFGPKLTTITVTEKEGETDDTTKNDGEDMSRTHMTSFVASSFVIPFH
jgi:hypothetical protein